MEKASNSPQACSTVIRLKGLSENIKGEHLRNAENDCGCDKALLVKQSSFFRLVVRDFGKRRRCHWHLLETPSDALTTTQ